jgi:peptidoglycan/LPS O-acetylase OafA/YrhL
MRFNNLQVLRLLAAVGVVLFHLGEYARLRFGVTDGSVSWLGMPWIASALVPLFFALSGFVLTLALQRTSPIRYLALRAVRIYPGFWLAVLAVLAVDALGLWPSRALDVAEPRPNLRSLFLIVSGPMRGGRLPLMIEWTLIYEVFLSVALLALRMIVGPSRLAWAAAVWLAVLAVKSVVWPGVGSQMLPGWRTIGVSVILVPFLLGVLAYQWRDVGKRFRWPVLAVAVAATLVAGIWVPIRDIEPHYWLRGVAAALTVWFLVQIPDVSPTNPLAVGGNASYGLYLVHVPTILLAIAALRHLEVGVGTWWGVAIVGAAAISVGWSFGRLESGLHAYAKRLVDRIGRRERKPVAPECVPVPEDA